jgi:hypothetical protein
MEGVQEMGEGGGEGEGEGGGVQWREKLIGSGMVGSGSLSIGGGLRVDGTPSSRRWSLAEEEEEEGEEEEEEEEEEGEEGEDEPMTPLVTPRGSMSSESMSSILDEVMSEEPLTSDEVTASVVDEVVITADEGRGQEASEAGLLSLVSLASSKQKEEQEQREQGEQRAQREQQKEQEQQQAAAKGQAVECKVDYRVLVTELYEKHNPEKIREDPEFVSKVG